MRKNNARKNKFLALLLSGMMISSMAVAFASCADDDSSSSSSSEDSSSTEATVKDDGLVKNAGFEIFTRKDGLNVIGTSVTSWSRKVNSPTSGSALSSKSASGIINTAEWKDLTTSNFPEGFSSWTEEQAAQNWANMTTKDKLAYYDVWKDNNDDDEKSISDLDFYQAFNVDSEDMPDCANPLTHDYVEGTESKNTNVLMIRNNYYNSTYKSIGTAQYFESSSTVTVKAGTSAQFSVWVKTVDLTSTSSSGEAQAAVDKGAFIRVKNSLGSTSFDPLEIKNINTEGVTTNNGWVQYKFYLQGSSYADATFTIVLGLGQGGGTDRSEYVNGYAFFDDIECKTITTDAYNTATGYDTTNKTYPATTKVVGHADEKSDKVLTQTDAKDYEKFAIDFAPAATAKTWDALTSTWTVSPTTEKSTNGTLYTAAANPASGVNVFQGLGIATDKDVKQVFAKASDMATVNNTYLTAVYNKHFKDSAFVDANDSVLMILSANGAAYTAKSDAMTVTLQPDSYKAISFFVKTSALNGFTGANATLVDGTEKISISSIDTTTLTGVDIDDENKDIYEGWQRCYFFISNETDSEKTCTISLGFGPTTVLDTTKSSYYTGFAAFTGFEEYDFADKKAFSLASGDSYSKVASLENKQEEAAGDAGFDAVANIPSDAIETGFANPKNYKGVYSDSDYVVANGTGANTAINTNANAGLLNKEHADTVEYQTLLTKINGGTATTWDALIGNDATQPLVIYNEGTQAKSYGFIGNSTEIAANSIVAVSLRLKVSNGAKANVYLVDTSDESNATLLSASAKLVYWYDDDGNVCVKDPSKNNFNPTRDIAFKLQANGLYKVNASWSGANTADATKYYANLSAYEKDAQTQDLLVAENGVSYDYTDNWLNDGNDGIAFYYKDGKYYANSQKAEEDEVLDLASVTALTPRYQVTANNENKQLAFEIAGSVATPVWQTVTFYVSAGDVAKNYRLEIWNGSRDQAAATNPAGSYVIVDSFAVDSADSRFAPLVTLRKQQIYDAATNKTATDLISADFGEYFESVFSFYDTAKFLRYDETADENLVGNSYEDYTSSSYTANVAYLKYVYGGAHEMYVDYTLTDATVNADVEEDSSDDADDDTDAEIDPATAWTLAGSIIIAAVLLFAVCAIIVRKLRAYRRASKPARVKKAKKDKKTK